MQDIRIRSHISDKALRELDTKVLSPNDIGLIVTDSATVRKPDGEILFVYLKGVVPPDLRARAYKILTTFRSVTDNRGAASGSQTVRVGQQTRAFKVISGVMGSFEGINARHPACRLTAWTREHFEEYQELQEYFQLMASLFEEYFPERYRAQLKHAQASHPFWIIPNTPFSTITINNSYATGVHTDANDFRPGFGVMTVLRKGAYAGGQFCFPRYRVGVDLQDGDVMLDDVHEYHGNIAIRDPHTGLEITRPTAEYERISVVCYARERIDQCKSPKDELELAKLRAGGIGENKVALPKRKRKQY